MNILSHLLKLRLRSINLTSATACLNDKSVQVYQISRLLKNVPVCVAYLEEDLLWVQSEPVHMCVRWELLSTKGGLAFSVHTY